MSRHHVETYDTLPQHHVENHPNLVNFVHRIKIKTCWNFNFPYAIMTSQFQHLQESKMGKILKAPEPKEIKDLRTSVQLTQQKAAELLHSNLRTFQRWEYGTTKMPYAYWELFAIKIEMLKMNGTTL